tara:strand:- start:1706 stop:2683 length:978 start_codon:yes stop_codon:yes gene_type:complete
MLAALLCTLLFSLSAVTARRTTEYMGGTETNFARLIIAPLVLMVFAFLFFENVSAHFQPNIFWLLFASGAIGFGLGDIALFQAFQRIGSRLTVLIVHCVAVPLALTVEFGLYKFGYMEKSALTSPSQIIFAVIILAGVTIALAPKENPHLEKSGLWSGIGWGLIAAFGQGIGAGTMVRFITEKYTEFNKLTGDEAFHAGLTVAAQRQLGGMVFTGLCLWALRTYLKGNPASPSARALTNPGSDWTAGRRWLLLNALAGPAFGVTCYQWALLNNPTGVILPIVATTPLVVIPFAIYMKEEKPSWRSLAGGVLAVAGVVGMVMWTQA